MSMNLIKQIEYNYITGLMFLILGLFTISLDTGILSMVFIIPAVIFGYIILFCAKGDMKAAKRND